MMNTISVCLFASGMVIVTYSGILRLIERLSAKSALDNAYFVFSYSGTLIGLGVFFMLCAGITYLIARWGG